MLNETAEPGSSVRNLTLSALLQIVCRFMGLGNIGIVRFEDDCSGDPCKRIVFFSRGNGERSLMLLGCQLCWISFGKLFLSGA